MKFLTTPLSSSHHKETFCCGNDSLDRYIKNQASQDIRKKVCACFVYPTGEREIKGYYTLSNGSIPRALLPESIIKNLPKYKALPVTLLGRLAVDKNSQGQNIGQLLLIDALSRCLAASHTIGSVAVIVDPIDESATSFYKKYDFILLPDSGKMFLMMETIEEAAG